MKETKQSVGTALGSFWNVEMQEDGSVVLWSDLLESHPPGLHQTKHLLCSTFSMSGEIFSVGVRTSINKRWIELLLLYL